jgi:uncharacterized membrane protein HdeD (DUF308 family)
MTSSEQFLCHCVVAVATCVHNCAGMPLILATTWLSLLIRGLVALVLGTLTVIWRDLSLYQLTLVFFGYTMIDGIVNLAGAITAAQSHERQGPLLFEAAAGIAAGLVAVMWSGLTAIGLIYIIAAWALVTGVLEIVSAFRLRKYVAGEWLLLLSGIASIALGLVMVAVPLTGASAVAFWLGVYAFVFGALLVALAFRLRGLIEMHREPNAEPAA